MRPGGVDIDRCDDSPGVISHGGRDAHQAEPKLLVGSGVALISGHEDRFPDGVDVNLIAARGAEAPPVSGKREARAWQMSRYKAVVSGFARLAELELFDA